MRLPTRSLVIVAAVSLVTFAAAAVAWAETCTLELKRLGKQGRSSNDYTYRATYPQSFFLQFVKNRGMVGDRRTNGRLQADREEGAEVQVGESLPRRRQVGLAGIRLRARRDSSAVEG